MLAATVAAEAHKRKPQPKPEEPKKMMPCKTVGPAASLADEIAALPDGGSLCLEPGTYALNVVVTRSITLRGAGPGDPSQIVLDGGGKGSVIRIGGTAPRVTLEQLTITGGANRNGGGGISATGDGELTLRQVVLRGNRAEAFGGAALLVGGGTHAYLDRCRVVGNRGGVGGAIIVDDVAQATLRHALIVDNQGTSSAVYAHDKAELTLTHVTIAGNHAAAALEVRGIAVRAPSVTVEDSILSATTAIANDARFTGRVLVRRTLLDGAHERIVDGSGNKTGAPAFVGTGGEPYRPSETSPARRMAESAGGGPDLAAAFSGTTAGALE